MIKGTVFLKNNWKILFFPKKDKFYEGIKHKKTNLETK